MSPESRLLDVDEVDGFIAQVWTGTSGTGNVYEGHYKSRTFETAYLEYGIMQELVKGTDKEVWFLQDPVEDNPEHGWEEYADKYKKTLTAALFWPDVDHYEVCPWPNRVFKGRYPRKVGLAEGMIPTEDMEGAKNIPDTYATFLAGMIQTLGDMTKEESETEKDAVIEYLENGGKAMIFSDYTEESMENFDAVLANYGVERTDGIVIEGDSQHYAQMPYYLVPTVNSTDAISDFASKGYYVLMPYAQGIKQTDNLRDTVTVNSLLTTSDSAYSKVDVNSGSIDKTDDDIDGPFDLGVSITETLDDDKETQIVYYTSSNLMDSQINQMVSGGNEQMIMSSLSWMCSSDETSTISVPSKNLQISYLTLTAYDVSFWKIMVMGIIPVIFLVIGFMVWLKRRKA